MHDHLRLRSIMQRTISIDLTRPSRSSHIR
jgi:hypothetical protein